tara:strand:- start:2600 stop:2881 length:282 start_codon:yes stop_codon:yes gene_type:complete
MDIIIYIFRLILILCFVHFVTYQYNIDLFNLWGNNKTNNSNNKNTTPINDNNIEDNKLTENNVQEEVTSNQNNDMEDNIKELQHSLKELEDYQ